MENKILDILPNNDDDGIRLDKLIANNLDISRTKAQELIRQNNVLKHGLNITDCSYNVKLTDHFTVIIPPPENTNMEATEIPLQIIYEDEHLAVINKQSGLTVHPGAGNKNNTLANALIHHFKTNLSSIGGNDRPGIVHRLDKDTSGLMLIVKDDKSHQIISEDLAKRNIKRHYLALCYGLPQPIKGAINAPIGRHPINRVQMTVTAKNSRNALTNYVVKETFCNNAASLVECKLETGRTHQIRVHLTHINHPIIGDQVYGIKSLKRNVILFPEEIQKTIIEFNRQALHAYYLSFMHPITKTNLAFEIPLPQDISNLINLLRLKDNKS